MLALAQSILMHKRGGNDIDTQLPHLPIDSFLLVIREEGGNHA